MTRYTRYSDWQQTQRNSELCPTTQSHTPRSVQEVAAAILLNDDDGIYQILTRAHKASLNASSWVPDWTVSYRGSAQLRQSEGKHGFKASGDRRRFVELRAGHGTNTASIAIQGTNVDIVSALFQYEWPQHEGDSFENHDIVSFRAFLADARSFVHQYASAYRNGVEDLLWRLPTMDRNLMSGGRASTDMRTLFARF
jgi:hypothetical protein